MIYVKGFHGTFSVDRKVSTIDNQRLYTTRKTEGKFPTVCESEADTKSAFDGWGGNRKDDSGQSNVQRDRRRLHDHQWF